MSAAQVCVTGRPDQVRAVIAAIRPVVDLSLVRPAQRLDANTVAVHLDVRVVERRAAA
jgi:hypothetical protein